MCECNGSEILQEVWSHLKFDPETVETANCIPCRMPYITSMFMPRSPGDRPSPVPGQGTRISTFISQFVEISEAVLFPWSPRCEPPQMAVYELLGIDRKIPPVTPHAQSLRVEFEALVKAFE